MDGRKEHEGEEAYPFRTAGRCPICDRETEFVVQGPWLRDQLLCARCGSIPRNRALVAALEEFAPRWRSRSLLEASPDGAASGKMRDECPGYVATHFYPGERPGAVRDGVRNENLEAMTFPDASFDLVVTQDVMEHVLDPAAAFRDIARVLRPGGLHVFTVPWYSERPTRVRAVRQDGAVRHLEEPDYHGNPIDPRGSLVVTEWGRDLCDFIYVHAGMTTTVLRILDRSRGIDGAFPEVFLSRRP